ncbi:brain-enriched guanylate kinase-associated protein isoform X2 [Pseudorasbora parva]
MDKLTDKLRRIQSSYAALQRINQDMQENIHRTTQRYEDEKRSLSREIVTLKKHLMEAEITIQKLRADNDLYRKDCNLAAQLLQCGKSPHRAHRLSELPADLQERVSSHMQKQSRGECAAPHYSCSDAVPTAIIGRILEKPEPGRIRPDTRSPSPQAQEFPQSGVDDIRRREAYKPDLCCSDTALYCPREPESFSQHRDLFLFGSLPNSSRLSSFGATPDEKAHVSKLPFPYRPGFSKSSSFHHVSQNGGAPSIPLKTEDIGSFFSSSEHTSPFSSSQRPAGIKPAPLYSSFPEGDHIFHTYTPDPRPGGSLPMIGLKRGLMFRSGPDSSRWVCRQTDAGGSSAESLSRSPEVQHYRKGLQGKTAPQESGSSGLSRKDSLTRAQLYGTLLN